MNKGLFTGYVLAGGKSKRMGRDKSMLTLAGKTLLERAESVLSPLCRGVKFVVGRDKFTDSGTFIHDIHCDLGPIGGIHAGFEDCNTEFAVILAVDLPLVSTEIIRQLCAAAIEAPEAAGVIPRQSDGRLQPLCAVYRPALCLRILQEFIAAQQTRAAGAFLAKIPVHVIESVEENGIDYFLNVNRPLDFEQLGDL
jgi:molybdenum cofactor guanylyltransferase